MAGSDRPALVAARVLAVVAVAWAALVPVAPRMLGVDGWPGRLAGAAYASGAVVCHQKPQRSFTSAGRPWPVCARCSGIYLTAGGTILLLGPVPVLRRRLEHLGRRAWRTAFAVALAPVGFTWFLERGGLATMSNAGRALSGLLLGAAVAAVLAAHLRGSAAAPVPAGPASHPRIKVN